MSQTRRLGAVDAMWLEMDQPQNLMVIDSLMWFDDPVDWVRLLDVLEHRVLRRYPVFRQRAVHPLGGLFGAYWEDDPDYDLDHHVYHVTLPGPGDDRELQRYVEDQVSRPIDRRSPLWEVHLVDGYHGGSAVLTRFHHALADGMALAQVLLSLTDANADGAVVPPPHALPVVLRPQPWAWLPGPLGPLARSGSAVATALAGFGDVEQLETLARTAARGLHVADKLLLGHNPVTPLSGRPGVAKRTVWSRPVPVTEVRRVGHAAGATVNDVLVAAVSGALTSYLVTHGGVPTDLTTMVPVDLRAPGAPLPRELGNRFALVLLPLPTGSLTPIARLAESKRRMDAIKRSPEAAMTYGLAGAIGRTHPWLSRPAVDFFSGKAIGVTTNVIGPREPRFLAGTRVAGVLGWVPGSGRQTVGVCIFSYDRTVRVGFKVDAGVVPDPERLTAAFDAEMDDYVRLAHAG